VSTTTIDSHLSDDLGKLCLVFITTTDAYSFKGEFFAFRISYLDRLHVISLSPRHDRIVMDPILIDDTIARAS
jgi:hypothetical protein